jgi:hypothetical protein
VAAPISPGMLKSQRNDSHNAPSCNALRTETMPAGHLMATDTCQIDPDLAAILDAWPTLPDALKVGIVAMVKAARK